MNKVRKILEKYAEYIEQTNKFAKFKSIPKFVSSDDFDKLEKELVSLLQEDKWISIGDELPKHRKLVLMFHMGFARAIGQYDCYEKTWYSNTRSNIVRSINKVTHWQPLPSSPTKPPITKKPKKRGGCNP